MADSATATYTFTLPEVGASEDTWGTKLNANWTALDALLDGTNPIAPNLVGWSVGGVAVTSTAAELNILDGVTANAAEINTLDGITSTTAELNILDGVTATAAEINALDGITATVTELNYTDGVTSNIQTQIDTKAPLASPALTGSPTAPTAAAATDTTQIATTAFVQDAAKLVLIEQQSIAGTPANVDFTFTPADYDHVYLDFNSVRSGTDGAQLCLRVFDSGGAVDDGVFDYGYNVISDILGASINGTGLGADSEIQMMPDDGIFNNAADGGAFGKITWHQCYQAQRPSFSFNAGYFHATNVFATSSGHGRRKAAGTFTGFRLFFLGGNTFVEGDFSLWGVKSS